MNRKTGVWAIAGVATVVPLLWLVTAPSGSVFQTARFPVHMPEVPPPPPPPPPTTTSTRTFTEPPHPVADGPMRNFVVPAWLFWTVSTVLLLLITVSVVVLTYRWMKEIKDSTVVDETELEAVDTAPEALIAQSAAMRDALRTGAPTDAVVACWAALEDAAQAAQVPIQAHETSSEYTERVIGTWVQDPAALRTLAALYREARFSQHALTEDARSRAIAALDVLLADLRTTRAERLRVTQEIEGGVP